MISSSRWLARLREFLRPALDADMDDELRLHRDLLADQYEREGLSREEALRRASLRLGGIEPGKEHVRDARGFPPLESLVRDVHHAVRVLVKAPAFSTVTILTLAFGIAVNVAIFSLVDAVVLRPLPYPDAERLISIWETNDVGRLVVAPGNLADYRSARSFSGIAGVSAPSRNLTGTGEPETLMTEVVTDNYFAVLGARAALGRTFTADDAHVNSPKVVILADALWRRRFGGSASIIGQRLLLDNVPHEVVGVMPADFRGLYDHLTPDRRSIWLPAAYPPELLANRGDHEVRAVARLADGVSIEAARAELTGISERLAVEYPATNEKVRAGMAPLRDDIVRSVRVSLVVLLLTVGLILTVACVNVANLFLARGVGRRREIALRFALGATRLRVVTALVVESVVLAAAAGLIGVIMGAWITSVLLAAAPADVPRLETVAMSGRVLVYAAAVTLVTGILFGIIPAWPAGHARPLDALAGSGRAVAGRAVMRWRNALMVTQIALSALLLVGAGLMVKSLLRLNSVALGFDASDVVAMRVTLPQTRYGTAGERLEFFETLRTQLSGVRGIDSIAYANALPMRGGWSSGFGIDGEPMPSRGWFAADFQAVSADYFTTLGIRLAQGRLFTSADHQQAPFAAVVSRRFERDFLGGRSALGRSIRRGETMPLIAIVGVVDDVRRDGRRSELQPQVYLHATQIEAYPVRLADIAIRTSLTPEALMPIVRTAVARIDPEQSISSVRHLQELIRADSATQRFQALLFSLFAVLALVLASVGTYGVVAYVVSQRTPEIGVRLALGASAWGIYRWLLARTAIVVITGAALGLIAARWAGQYVSSLLYEVTVSDAPSYALAAGVLLAVAFAACMLAGWRAVHIDPTAALRYE